MSIPAQRPGAAEAEASSVQSVSQWNQSGGCHLSTAGSSHGSTGLHMQFSSLTGGQQRAVFVSQPHKTQPMLLSDLEKVRNHHVVIMSAAGGS